MVEPTGYTALDLIGFTDKGTYSALATYVKNDLVHYSGNIWRVLVDDLTGVQPSEGASYTLFIGEPTNLIEEIIAPIEQSVAVAAHTTGSQLIYNDTLYDVISNIAIGDSLMIGTNIQLAERVTEQIGDIKADLDGLDAEKAEISAIGTDETGNANASRAYGIGDYFYKDGKLGYAKTAISNGAALTKGTNYEEKVLADLLRLLCPTEISSVDLNTVSNPGFYYLKGSITNGPISGVNYGVMYVFKLSSSTQTYTQVAYMEQRDTIYIRHHTSSGWGSWMQATMTAV